MAGSTNDKPPLGSEVEAPDRCANCDARLSGRYCSDCGQDNHRNRVRLSDWLRDLAAGFSSFDSKSGRTIRGLTFNPGALARDYVSGKRAPYIPPLRYAIATSAIWFLSLTLSTPSASELVLVRYGQAVNLLLVPLLALAVQLAFRGSRSTYTEVLCFLLFVVGHVFLWRAFLPPVGRFVPATEPYLNSFDATLFMVYATCGMVGFFRGRVRFLAVRIVVAILLITIVGTVAIAIGMNLSKGQ